MTAAALVGTVPGAASAQSTPGEETFTIIVAGDAPQIFHAQGTIDATGTAIEVTSNGPSGGTDLVKLPGGSFMLTLQNAGGGPGSDPAPCISGFSGTGNWTIFGGTGRFAGIDGTGTQSFQGIFVQTPTPPAGCSQQGTVFDLVQGQGTVTLQ